MFSPKPDGEMDGRTDISIYRVASILKKGGKIIWDFIATKNLKNNNDF